MTLVYCECVITIFAPVCGAAVLGASRTLPLTCPAMLLLIVYHTITGIQHSMLGVILNCDNTRTAFACHSKGD